MFRHEKTPFLRWASTLLAVAILATVVVLIFPHWPAPSNPAWTGETMGTTYSIKLAGADLSLRQLAQLKKEVDEALAEVNRQMSHYRPDSELSQFNRSTSMAPFQVSEPFAAVVRFAVELNRKSHGAFDPTLGPLIDLWGFGPAGRTNEAPTAKQLDDAMKISGCRHLSVTPEGKLRKDVPELRLNLSAVAKGFGVDEATRVIRAHGITNVLVEIGGEVVALGFNADGEKWRVGVDAPNPDAVPASKIEAILRVSGLAVATSGDYRNFFVDAEGRSYTHILNPITGRPVRHHLASVTVVASNCLTADGLATTLFVLGEEEGPRWIKDYPGAEALFIVREEGGLLVQIASSNFTAVTGYTPPEPPKGGRGTRWDVSMRPTPPLPFLLRPEGYGGQAGRGPREPPLHRRGLSRRSS